MTHRDEVYPIPLEQDFLARLEASGLSSETRQAVTDIFRAAVASQLAPQEEGSQAHPERLSVIEAIANDPQNIHVVFGVFSGGEQRVVGYQGWGDKQWMGDRLGNDVFELPKAATIEGHAFLQEMHKQMPRSISDRYAGINAVYFEGIVFKLSSIIEKARWSDGVMLPRQTYVGFKLEYGDDRGPDMDSRPGTTTTYTLLLPVDSPHIPHIETDPTIMVDLLQTVMPEADRSRGRLHLADLPIQEI